MPPPQEPRPDARSSPALLRAESLTLRYPSGRVALDGLDLHVGPREFVSLLGPSGCGKSSALRLIAGLLRPTTGRLTWQTGDAPSLGFVFQEPTLMPWATVRDNVALPLRLQRQARAEASRAAEEALARVGLADVAGALPRELSGGMKMRASIARALVTRPRLLLLDEPFAALDEMTRLKLNDDLLAVQAEQGFAVLFVTHSVYESVYLSDRVVVMTPHPGRAHASVAIDAPRPRDESFRLAPTYGALCRAVSTALREALVEPATSDGSRR